MNRIGIEVPSPEIGVSAAGARHVRAGVLYGVAAYAAWALAALYFKWIEAVAPAERWSVWFSAFEVLAHRVIWSAILLTAWLKLSEHWGQVSAALRDARLRRTLLVTTVLITVNWGTFIIAVATDRVLDASLGYFVNPLVSVLLGFVLLGERLRFWQVVSVVLAAAGVAWLIVGYGRVPVIALILAVSFAIYGLLRKTAPVNAVVGLTVETLLLLPAALLYAGVLAITDRAVFLSGTPQLDGLLALAGVVTIVPLVWFTVAARRLRLATIGLLQYIAPTGQFLLAVLAFGEPFTRAHAISFGLIWAGLLIYSLDSALRHAGRRWPRRAVVAPAAE